MVGEVTTATPWANGVLMLEGTPPKRKCTEQAQQMKMAVKKREQSRGAVRDRGVTYERGEHTRVGCSRRPGLRADGACCCGAQLVGYALAGPIRSAI